MYYSNVAKGKKGPMNDTTTSPPLEPPNISSMHIDTPPTPTPNPSSEIYPPLSFEQTLLANNKFTPYSNTCHQTHSHIDLTDETINNLHQDTFIPLAFADKSCLYSP